jgi:hypothetical protein
MYTLDQTTVAGSASFSKYLDITKDIVVSFDYACYGPNANGNEGFCVFFSNPANPVIQGGGMGPGLAYSSVTNIDPSQISIYNPSDLNGLQSGLLGVGFDFTGNFGSNTYNPNDSGYIDTVTNSIVLRSSYGSDFDIITRTSNLNSVTFGKPFNLYQQIKSDEVPIFKRVRVRLTDFGQRIVVDLKTVGDLNFTNYLNYSFTSYNNAILSSTDTTTTGTPLSGVLVQFTPSVQCGLGFSTGEDSTTIFKIRNFNINGVFTTEYRPGTYTYDVDTTTLSATQNYTSPASPYFFAGDIMDIQNTYDGVLNHTYTGAFSTTNPAITGNPLLNVIPGTAGPGAPYRENDIFVKITPHA